MLAVEFLHEITQIIADFLIAKSIEPVEGDIVQKVALPGADDQIHFEEDTWAGRSGDDGHERHTGVGITFATIADDGPVLTAAGDQLAIDSRELGGKLVTDVAKQPGGAFYIIEHGGVCEGVCRFAMIDGCQPPPDQLHRCGRISRFSFRQAIELGGRLNHPCDPVISPVGFLHIAPCNEGLADGDGGRLFSGGLPQPPLGGANHVEGAKIGAIRLAIRESLDHHHGLVTILPDGQRNHGAAAIGMARLPPQAAGATKSGSGFPGIIMRPCQKFNQRAWSIGIETLTHASPKGFGSGLR